MLDVRLSMLVFCWTSQCSLMDNYTSCHRVAVTRAILVILYRQQSDQTANVIYSEVLSC